MSDARRFWCHANRRPLERIFDYRRHVVSQIFGDARAAPTGALAAPDERK